MPPKVRLPQSVTNTQLGIHPHATRANNYIGGPTLCKGTITREICLMHASNRIESQAGPLPEDLPVPGLQDTDPLGNNMLRDESIGLDTEAVDWECATSVEASERIYLPAVTYFPTPSPEQYRRR